MSRVSLIGTGNVARTLGSRLSLQGRPIAYGTRDVNSPKIEELKQQQDVAVKTVPAAVDWAGIIILAVPGAKQCVEQPAPRQLKDIQRMKAVKKLMFFRYLLALLATCYRFTSQQQQQPQQQQPCMLCMCISMETYCMRPKMVAVTAKTAC
jgi:hypothetical protein